MKVIKIVMAALMFCLLLLQASCSSRHNPHNIKSTSYNFNSINIKVRYSKMEKEMAVELMETFSNTKDEKIKEYIKSNFNNRLGKIFLTYSCSNLSSDACYYLIDFGFDCSGSVSFAYTLNERTNTFIFNKITNEITECCFSPRKNRSKPAPIIKWND
jgi:hypothetical protein